MEISPQNPSENEDLTPPLKLLVVSFPIAPARGGSVVVMENILQALDPDEVCAIGEIPVWGSCPKRDSPKVEYFRSGISFFGRGGRFFKWIRWMLFPLLVRRICKFAKQEGCNYVLAVYPEELYCFAGCMAAKRLGLKFSTYFHNTYGDNIAVNQQRSKRIQAQLFGTSEWIFSMSDGMKKHFETVHGLKNVVSLVHTFRAFPEEQNCYPGIRDGKRVRLVMFGNFNQSNIEATSRFLAAVKREPKFEVSLYTHVPLQLLRMRGLDTGSFVYKGFIGSTDEELMEELKQYDITVLTHGFDGDYGPVEYKTIFPTRTIPMMVSARPLFVHAPAESFISDFIKENKAGVVVNSRDKDKIIAGLTQLCTDKQLAQTCVDNALRAAEMFRSESVIKTLRSVIRGASAS